MLGAPAGAHVLVGFRGKPVFVVAGSGLGPGVPGYTLIADESIGGDVYAAFAAKVRMPPPLLRCAISLHTATHTLMRIHRLCT